MARERGFKGIVAVRGDEGVALAHEYKPDAIMLDMGLPVQDGWQVLEHLKRHPETRHIPVHIVSGGVENGGVQDALRAGAVAVLEKPVEHERLDEQFGKILEFVERGVRRLLIVDDDEAQRHGDRRADRLRRRRRDHRRRLVARRRSRRSTPRRSSTAWCST